MLGVPGVSAGFWRRGSPVNTLLSSKIGNETKSAVSFAAGRSADLHQIPLHRGSQEAETAPAVKAAERCPSAPPRPREAPERRQEAATAHT